MKKKSNNKSPINREEIKDIPPPKWTLLSTISSQLKKAGYITSTGSLGDGSGSWISIYRAEDKDKLDKPGILQSIVIHFDNDGDIITGINVYQEVVRIKEPDSQRIW